MKPCEGQFASRNASEGVELRNNSILYWAKGFISLKPVLIYAKKERCFSRFSTPIMRGIKGEYISTYRSLSPQRVSENDYIGTWENHIVPFRSCKQVEQRQECGMSIW